MLGLKLTMLVKGATVQHQAIIWTNAGLLSTGPLGKYISEIRIKTQQFSLKIDLNFYLSSNSECVEIDCAIPTRVNYNRHQTIQKGHLQAAFKWYTSPQEHGPILCCMHSARHRPTQIAAIKILRKQHHQGCTYCFDKTWLGLNSSATRIFRVNTDMMTGHQQLWYWLCKINFVFNGVGFTRYWCR